MIGYTEPIALLIMNSFPQNTLYISEMYMTFHEYVGYKQPVRRLMAPLKIVFHYENEIQWEPYGPREASQH